MWERANRFGGKLEFWSKAGAGTEAVLTVPAAIVYRLQQGPFFVPPEKAGLCMNTETKTIGLRRFPKPGVQDASKMEELDAIDRYGVFGSIVNEEHSV